MCYKFFTFFLLALPYTTMAQILSMEQKQLLHPAGFWENGGQLKNQEGQPRDDIEYFFPAQGMQVHLKNNGWSYQLNRLYIDTLALPERQRLKKVLFDSIGLYRLDISWKNASNNWVYTPEKKAPDFNNYYLGSDSFIQVNRFEQLQINNAYPGLNIITRTRLSHFFEYDLEIAPGFDMSQLRMQVSGADSVFVNEKNELVMRCPLGDLIEKIPASWQLENGLKKNLAVLWAVEGDEVRFVLPREYNPALPLVIDPWATYYGGGQEYGEEAATDASNNVYAVGYTSSSNLIATSGTFQSTISSGATIDAYLVRFASNGARNWGTYYGGSLNESNVRVDIRGSNLAIAFSTSSSGLASSGAFRTSLPGSNNVLISRFNPSNGTRVWATYYGGNISDIVYGIAFDNSNNIYVAGTTISNTGLASSGAFKTSIGGNSDAFIAKFNINGAQQWSTYFGGNADDNINDIALDNANQVLVVGNSSSPGIATAGVHQTVRRGFSDGFVARFSGNGTRTWCTYYGGNGEENLQTVACDLSQRTFVGGKTFSTSFIATTGAFKTSLSSGAGNGMLARFSLNGTLDYGTYYGGDADDYVEGIKVDASGNIYFCGYTNSSTGIATTGAHRSSNSGGYDAFVGKFTGGGVRLWASYYGGTGFEVSGGMALDASANVIITGYTSSNNGIAFGNALQGSFPSSGGGVTTFIAHFSTNGLLPVEWLNVEAKARGEKSVLVSWSTSAESNNAYFLVEHSNNGKDFTPVSPNIKGSVNSSSIRSYQYLHQNPERGINYYRIRQVDFNNAYDFSEIRPVQLQVAAGSGAYAFKEQNSAVIRSYEGAAPELLSFSNSNGIPIPVNYTIRDKDLRIELPAVAPGVYIISIKQFETIQHLKIII